MPAGLPGSTPVQNAANPSAGAPVIFDVLSGPKGAPLDNDKDYATGTGVANANASTGALQTGIGFGPTVGPVVTIPPNFNDDYTPGVTKPDNTGGNSTMMYIGGGKCTKNVDGNAPAVPYTTGFGLGAAGNSAARDAGAGPAFTGFLMKMVTGAVAAGAVVETGFNNRSGAATTAGQSVFGVSTTATAVPAMAEMEYEDKEAELARKEVEVENLKRDVKTKAEADAKRAKEEEVVRLEKEMRAAAEKEEQRIKDEEEGEKRSKVRKLEK